MTNQKNKSHNVVATPFMTMEGTCGRLVSATQPNYAVFKGPTTL